MLEPNPRRRSWLREESRRAIFARGALRTMAVKLDEIRTAAQRVAASHGLDVVDIEFTGPAKERTLRVTLEKNAEGRAQLKARLACGPRRGRPEGPAGAAARRKRWQWSSFPA